MVVKIWKTWLFRVILLVLFAVSLLFILFLANGYQYDFFSNQIRKTGIIDIDYSDPQAKVYLEGVKLEGHLPFVASNVLPGIYNLVIGREEYYDYSLKVKVEENLISKVDSVFLYPLDILANSRFIADWPKQDFKNMMADGYIFRQTGNHLNWAKLRENLTDKQFLEATALNEPLASIQILGKEALLNYADGRRQILDMFSGVTEKAALPEQYVFGGDKWFYYKDNLLTAFDRELTRVLWVKKIAGDVKILDLHYWQVENREFLGLDLNGPENGALYELKGDSLQRLLNKRIDDLQINDQNELIYTIDDSEIWKWPKQAKSPLLLARFQGPVEILAVDLDFYKTNRVLIFKTKQKYFIADEGFDNVREMFPHLNVDQVAIIDHGKVFYVDQYQQNEQAEGSRLLMLDLEQ